MDLTLGFTGMDSQTESRLRSTFESIAPRLAAPWTLASTNDARYVVVDMDSMYGPMSWLSLGNAGKQIIGLTQSERTRADFLLRQPASSEALHVLLDAIARSGEAPLSDAATPVPAVAPVTAVPLTSEAEAEVEPMPVDQAPAPVQPPPPAPVTATEPELPAAWLESTTPAADAGDAAQLQDPPAEPVAAPPASAPRAWYHPKARTGRWLLAVDELPALLLDYDAGLYHGPTTLKPLKAVFERFPVDADLQPLDGAAWDARAETGEEAHLLQRLNWYGALLAGNGQLQAGLDPEGRFTLGKWPRTEREFPRHFRIATTMMRGPATITEIAQASEVPPSEVIDFINAHIASGHAAPVVDTPAPEPEAPRSGGLLSRLRGKSP